MHMRSDLNKVIDLRLNVKHLRAEIRRAQTTDGARFQSTYARAGIAALRARRAKLTNPGLFGRRVKLTHNVDTKLKNIDAELNAMWALLSNWNTRHHRERGGTRKKNVASVTPQ